VTRAAAADRNARRVGGQIAEAPHKSEHKIRDNQVQSHWIPACAGMTKKTKTSHSVVEKRLRPAPE